MILEAYKFRGYNKGARGIHMRLLHQEPPVLMNVKKVRRLMQKYNLVCPIRKVNPYRKLGKQLQEARVVPNLLNQEFRQHGERKVLLSDITYIPRRQQTANTILKFSYLCVIMDAYTKEVLAWSISGQCDTDIVLEALESMMQSHGSELKTDALFHSDQGSQYTSIKLAEVLGNTDLRRSMSRKACCWDNAPQESLFGHMKDEIHLNPSDCHSIIAKKVADWIDYYNHDRYQWGLARLSPKEFYRYATTGNYPLSIKPSATAEGVGV